MSAPRTALVAARAMAAAAQATASEWGSLFKPNASFFPILLCKAKLLLAQMGPNAHIGPPVSSNYRQLKPNTRDSVNGYAARGRSRSSGAEIAAERAKTEARRKRKAETIRKLRAKGQL